MKSRTATTMIMMMVVLLVVPLLNVEGHDLVTADVPTTTPPATTTASTTSQPHPPTTPTSQPHPPTTPTSQPHPPTTPATMKATATPARTQTTGPEKVESTSCTTSTKEDATALSRGHYVISVAALVLSICHLALHLAMLIFDDEYPLRFRDGLTAASMEMIKTEHASHASTSSLDITFVILLIWLPCQCPVRLCFKPETIEHSPS
ncbi:uncharacterized protein LOC135805943 [Sycon ciliatum]|uniref:uncharacterized protein LOC135805943 n=1 Tax=Sycon ciliatum TaxID=27933 RepID=UPI0031F6C598